MKRRLFLKSGLSAGLGTLLLPENAFYPTPHYSEEEIPVIDTHMHLWDLQKLNYPWLENQNPPLNKNFLIPDYYKATQDIPIKKIVFVESACLAEQYLKEVEWVVGLSKIEPRIQGIVAHLPMETKRDLIPNIETLLECRIVKGIRHGVNKELLDNANFLSNIQLLSRHQFSFDLNISSTLVPEALPLIRKCPDTVFILDHLCNPNIKDQELGTWKAHLKELAEMNNVYCKISGLITKTNLFSWKSEDLKPYIDHALEMFGPERLMFGSDWPVLLRAGSYQNWYSSFLKIVDQLSTNEKHQVLYYTAELVYRL